MPTVTTRKTILLKTRVPASRMRRVGKVFAQLGLEPDCAINAFLAQVEMHKAIPFPIGPDLTEEQEILADPAFRKFLADRKAGKIKYYDASEVSL
jgi:antitoxin component of RelBE/YafQ-DinJ toxin-antitoxin module